MVSLSQLLFKGKTSSLVTIFLVVSSGIIICSAPRGSIKIVKEYRESRGLTVWKLLGAKGRESFFIAPIVNRLQK